MFSKRVGLQKHKFSSLFQSISYDNVVVTKQIYFSSTFLKLWVHMADNAARVVGGSQYSYRSYKHREFPVQ